MIKRRLIAGLVAVLWLCIVVSGSIGALFVLNMAGTVIGGILNEVVAWLRSMNVQPAWIGVIAAGVLMIVVVFIFGWTSVPEPDVLEANAIIAAQVNTDDNMDPMNY